MNPTDFNRSELHAILKALDAQAAAGEFDRRGARLRVQVKRKIAVYLANPNPCPAAVDLAALRDDLAKLAGRPPYDGPSNIVCGDGYFAKSLEEKHGADMATLYEWAKGGR